MADHIYVNGRFHIASQARIPVDDRGFLYGDGVFETMRSYGGSIFMLPAHMDRLFGSLKALKFSPGFDRAKVADVIYKALARSGLAEKDAYIKVIVTRGRHKDGLHFNAGSRCSLVVIVKKLKPYPGKYYSNGVDVISSSVKRRPVADRVHMHKLISYFENLYEKDRAHSRGAFESIFTTRDRLVLEGSTTNIFTVTPLAVYTPPITQNILPGITRAAVLGLCRENNIRVCERKIHYYDLINAREVFLTNSVAGILPVRKVDTHYIGKKVPGATTSRLADLYRMAVRENQDII